MPSSRELLARVKAHITEIDGAAAQQRLADGKQFGKIVLTP